jgi:hypothetical protein
MLPKFGNADDISFMSTWQHGCRTTCFTSSVRRIGPKYFCPADKKCITAEDIVQFFGCQLAPSFWGNPSIEQTWLTKEALDVIGTCMGCVPRCAFEDMYRCLHFDDDQDDSAGEWDKIYQDQKCAVQMTRLIITINLPYWKRAST